MPRGNDAAAALKDLADKFGKGVGNAEQLIEANLKMYSQELRRAEILPRDDEATAEVRKDLSKLKGPNGEPVMDAAVRGGTTVIVYQDEDGRHRLATTEDEPAEQKAKPKGKANSDSDDKE